MIEEPSTLTAAKEVLFTLGVVLAGGSVAAVLAKAVRAPDVVVYLLMGIVLGPDMLGLVRVEASSSFNQAILIFGASYILFDGGASLRFGVVRSIWRTIVLLSTLGVVVTAVLVAGVMHFLVGVPWILAMLVAAVVASTDPATLVPIFKQVAVRARLSQAVMAESAFNDATGAILTFTVLAFAVGAGDSSLWSAAEELVKQSALGVVIGVVFGGLAAVAMSGRRYGLLREFAPIVTLMAVAGAYLSADRYHASGFMAAFVFGAMIGNRDAFGLRMTEYAALKMSSFVTEIALIMRLLIFVLLGSQVSFELVTEYWLEGMATAAALMFVARPAAVFLATMLDRPAAWTMKERLFLCWTRETGVIPAALAGLLGALGAPGADLIAAITFVAILTTILVQAPSTRWLAAKLGVLEQPRELSGLSL